MHDYLLRKYSHGSLTSGLRLFGNACTFFGVRNPSARHVLM